ncbi:MAG TPA: hypothetical protein VFJ82_00255 [Longimicrobium sp.]|nr:hypothetical protein [Longimicrobium sp.]
MKLNRSLTRSLVVLGVVMAATPLTRARAQSDIECDDPTTEDGITCVGCWDNNSSCVGAGCTDGKITVIIVEC